MSGMTLLWTAIAGLLLVTFSATAAKVLNDFSRHEFEDYCRRRRNSKLFARMVDEYRQFCLGAEVVEMLGISIMIICGSFYLLDPGENEQIRRLPESILVPGIVLSTAVLLLTSSWVPWAVVEYFSAPFLYHTWRLWWFVSIMFKPVLIGMEFVGGFLGRLSGHVADPDEEEEEIEDEILSMVSAGQTGGFLHSDAREMIEGVIELDDLVVGKIMTPRSSVNAVSVEATWDEIIQQFLASRHSRLPVYREDLDNIVGILHTRDVLTEGLKPEHQRKSIVNLMRRPLKTPDSRFVNEMLKVFLEPGNKIHLAVVVNEHHTVVGVITIEDILEEIVGDITDETDRQSEPRIKVISESEIEVPGRFRIDELNDEVDFEIPEDDEYDTVAGWILYNLGEVPIPKHQFEASGVRCTILQSTPRRIESVRLLRLRIEDDTKDSD